MRIVVLGARGGVGRHAVQVAAEQGHEVVAGARGTDGPSVPPGVQRRAVDVRDPAAVAEALVGADAVLWCVGVTKSSGPDVGRVGIANVVHAAGPAGVSRLVSVSGAGVTLPQDTKGLGARLVSALTRRLARDLVLDKEGEHAVLAASDLAWTEVRAPRLVDGAGTGAWTLDRNAPGLSAAAVAKEDVASAMVSLAGSQEWVRESPFLHRAGKA